MLIGISPLLSPELLATLHRMGHGDEIVLADAHFPGESLGPPVIRADGLKVASLLDAILPLFKLDSYIDHPLNMMAAVPGDTLDPAVELAYRSAVDKHWPETPTIGRIERFAFYERAKQAYCVIQTSERRFYGCFAFRKGVLPPDDA